MTRQWIPVDRWLAGHDATTRAASVRVFDYQVPIGPLPPLPRHRPDPPPVFYRYPRPPSDGPDPWPDLRARLDRVVERIRRQPKRNLAGRRVALIEREDLAREVYELIQERGARDALIQLDVSRQALFDTWHAHGWPAPLGSGNYVRRTA